MDPSEKMTGAQLSKIEPIVREYCANVFRRHAINPSHVEVYLSTELNAIQSVFGGSPVKLILRWPEISSSINIQLKDFCRMFHKHKLHREMQVVPYALVKTNEKWAKERINMELGEASIVYDLVPKHRLLVTKKETVTLKDTVTGKSVSMEYEYKASRFDGSGTELWVRLSRIVRDSTPIDDSEDGS